MRQTPAGRGWHPFPWKPDLRFVVYVALSVFDTDRIVFEQPPRKPVVELTVLGGRGLTT